MCLCGPALEQEASVQFYVTSGLLKVLLVDRLLLRALLARAYSNIRGRRVGFLTGSLKKIRNILDLIKL
jgi:hypothetical protein